MCGIGGIINLENKSINLVDGAEIISKTLQHRGPDDEGFLFFKDEEICTAYGDNTQKESINNTFNFSAKQHLKNVEQGFKGVFIHRRLSIIDISESGHQPMATANSKVWITFNGEIYNYIELRTELEKAGHIFKTQSDTEVLLNAYLHWGKECLQKLNGMFSFTILPSYATWSFVSGQYSSARGIGAGMSLLLCAAIGGLAALFSWFRFSCHCSDLSGAAYHIGHSSPPYLLGQSDSASCQCSHHSHGRFFS